MSRSTSFFLDLLRLFAAGSVFASHCLLIWYPGLPLGRGEVLSHRAVIIFFVLSGYVIAYSTLRKPTSLRDYAAARLSRLYSVVLPALLLTAFLHMVGARMNPAFYSLVDRGHDLLRYFLATFFLQSFWTTNTAPPTNGPLWSLGYEFWYYAAFAAAVFIRPVAWRIGVIVLLLGSVGINVILLMPSWVLGAMLYIYGRRKSVPRGWARTGALAAMIACGAAMLLLPNWPGPYGKAPWFYSGAFVTDGIVGVLLAAWIGLADQAFIATVVNARLDAAVRWIADHTFSLYLYHYPLLLFVTAVIPFDRANPFEVGGITVLVLVVILLLSLVTESARGSWRRFFCWCWDRCAGRVASQPRSAG